MKTIALTGGGTGGHIYPLSALYNYLKDDKNLNFIWVGEDDSLEQMEAERLGILFVSISAGKIRRYFDVRNLYEPLKNSSGVFQGINIIKKYNIDMIFSKGGYVSFPLCAAAKVMRIPVYLHESDAVTGISNGFFGKIAKKVFYTYDNEYIDGKKHILSGQIMNQELLDNIEDLEVKENKFLNVLVIAGSQGSTRIFNSIGRILPELGNIKFTIVLGTKNLHFRESFSKFTNVTVYDFLPQAKLGTIYKTTDIAISRASSLLWDLYSFGIFTIMIPLSESANNHQQANAEYFHEKYEFNIVNESENMDNEILALLNKYQDLRKVGLNLDGFFKPLEIIKKEIFKED